MITDLITHPADRFQEVYADIIDRYGRPKELSIRSLPKLDNKIWGLKKKNLVLVAGRPSSGKSSVALQWGFDFAMQGKSVVLFSLEMTTTVCIERLFCNYCEIDNYLVTTGKIVEPGHDHQDKMNEFYAKLKGSKFVIVESIGKTFDEIFKIIENFTQPVDVVIIDYLQMVKATPRQTKKDAIDDYIKKLRNYAIQKNFCAIVGCQISRATHEQHKLRYPELWELKGSGEIEEAADLAFLLHWEYFYTREEESKNKYIIKVAKNRNGRTGIFECAFFPQYYKIGEADGNETETENSFRRDWDN